MNCRYNHPTNHPITCWLDKYIYKLSKNTKQDTNFGTPFIRHYFIMDTLLTTVMIKPWNMVQFVYVCKKKVEPLHFQEDRTRHVVVFLISLQIKDVLWWIHWCVSYLVSTHHGNNILLRGPKNLAILILRNSSGCCLFAW
jgi:hypothetical protein